MVQVKCFFSQSINLLLLVKILNLTCKTVEGLNDFILFNKLVKNINYNKEYFLTIGGHASIVRKTLQGLEFLELQDYKKNNGWYKLNIEQLKIRFGCKIRDNEYQIAFLIDVDNLLKKNTKLIEFKEILAYINTEENKRNISMSEEDKNKKENSISNSSKTTGLDYEYELSKYKLYKKNKNDKIWWVDNYDTFGIWIFTFDKKEYFSFFKDYPHKLTPEQKAIFDKENPYWAERRGGIKKEDIKKDENNKGDEK